MHRIYRTILVLFLIITISATAYELLAVPGIDRPQYLQYGESTTIDFHLTFDSQELLSLNGFRASIDLSTHGYNVVSCTHDYTTDKYYYEKSSEGLSLSLSSLPTAQQNEGEQDEAEYDIRSPPSIDLGPSQDPFTTLADDSRIQSKFRWYPLKPTTQLVPKAQLNPHIVMDLGDLVPTQDGSDDLVIAFPIEEGIHHSEHHLHCEITAGDIDVYGHDIFVNATSYFPPPESESYVIVEPLPKSLSNSFLDIAQQQLFGLFSSSTLDLQSSSTSPSSSVLNNDDDEEDSSSYLNDEDREDLHDPRRKVFQLWFLPNVIDIYLKSICPFASRVTMFRYSMLSNPQLLLLRAAYANSHSTEPPAPLPPDGGDDDNDNDGNTNGNDGHNNVNGEHSRPASTASRLRPADSAAVTVYGPDVLIVDYVVTNTTSAERSLYAVPYKIEIDLCLTSQLEEYDDTDGDGEMSDDDGDNNNGDGDGSGNDENGQQNSLKTVQIPHDTLQLRRKHPATIDTGEHKSYKPSDPFVARAIAPERNNATKQLLSKHRKAYQKRKQYPSLFSAIGSLAKYGTHVVSGSGSAAVTSPLATHDDVPSTLHRSPDQPSISLELLMQQYRAEDDLHIWPQPKTSKFSSRQSHRRLLGQIGVPQQAVIPTQGDDGNDDETPPPPPQPTFYLNPVQFINYLNLTEMVPTPQHVLVDTQIEINRILTSHCFNDEIDFLEEDVDCGDPFNRCTTCYRRLATCHHDKDCASNICVKGDLDEDGVQDAEGICFFFSTASLTSTSLGALVATSLMILMMLFVDF